MLPDAQISQGALFLPPIQDALLLRLAKLFLRHQRGVVVRSQPPAPLLLHPHPGEASVLGNNLALVLPLHG